MLENIAGFFSLPLAYRALAVGVLVALCAALLGVSLVLKRYSMIGDGLSHVAFGALAVASALNIAEVSLQFSLPIVVAAAFLLLRISESSRIKGDAAIAMFSTVSLAVGYIILTKSGTNTDINNYMFGSILTVSKTDAIITCVAAAVIIGLFFIFYNRIFAITFDETFSKAAGMKSGFYNFLVAALTATTVVLGMKLVGTLLISALIIFPALSAMRINKSFRAVVIFAAVISVLCFVLGLFASVALDTPAGSTVVIVNAALFLVLSAVSAVREK